ncbi:hypothetical protein HGRIS_013327 [Hohenbuehelia grisea]|uniref:NADH dehydrogenase [ubiquinone] 1 beta subcomplex subunit 4 n=1 Tax=Hohenbuehelia grisea TaxID=104357 RepID=A0ABR3IV42_9AGAR
MGHGAVKVDPAIERFNRMREEAYTGFRWTRRTVRTALLGMVIAPGLMFFAAYQTNRRWYWVGKEKGQALARIPQPQPDAES